MKDEVPIPNRCSITRESEERCKRQYGTRRKRRMFESNEEKQIKGEKKW